VSGDNRNVRILATLETSAVRTWSLLPSEPSPSRTQTYNKPVNVAGGFAARHPKGTGASGASSRLVSSFILWDRAASRGGRGLSGALCPPVNLVPGGGADIIGGAPRRVPVWEIAFAFNPSCARGLPFFFSSTGRPHDPRPAAAFSTTPSLRAAAHVQRSCCGHRHPCRDSLGRCSTRTGTAATAQPSSQPATPGSFLWHLHRRPHPLGRLANPVRR
jgi:hypothetical protein